MEHKPIDPIAARARAPSRGLRQRLSYMLVGLDLTAMIVALLAASLIWHGSLYRTPEASFALATAYFVFALSNGAYAGSVFGVARRDGTRETVWVALKSFLAALLLVTFITFVLKEQTTLSRAETLIGAALFVVLVTVGRWFWARWVIRNWPQGVLRIGLIRDTDGPAVPGDFSVVVEAGDWLDPAKDCPEMYEELSLKIQGCDRVVVACSAERRAQWSALLRGMGIRTELVAPEIRGAGVLDLARFNGMRTLVIDYGPMRLFDRIAKRAVDLLVTIPAIIVLLPVYLVVAIAIKLDSPGPVLFVQDRLGLANRRFKMLKFRSMRVEGSDAKGNQSTQRDDPRITKLGNFLRKTSIDELPQLFNVLTGSMSIVGPRPHALGSRAGNELFWEVDNRYWHRHAVKPGLTGLAQVRGYRGATHTTGDLQMRLNSDLEYVRDWSLFLDFWIIFATLRVMVHRNAY